VLEMAFASEEPYERWWGIEVLDTSEGAVRLSRLNDGASVLFNHNPDDLRGVHVPGSVRTDSDRVLRGKVRITSVTQTGRDAIGLIKSGVLSKSSVGYMIHRVIEQSKDKAGKAISREIDGRMFDQFLGRMTEQDRNNRKSFNRSLDEKAGAFARANDDEPSVFRVVDWEPFENSLVTIPADATVGIGRALSEEFEVRILRASQAAVPAEGAVMTEEEKAAAAAAAIAAGGSNGGGGATNATDLEKARKRAIENLCKANKLDDKYREMWTAQGISIEDVSEDILRILEERGKNNPQPLSRLGLTDKETQRFSLVRAIRAVSEKDWKNAQFELECSRAIAERMGRVAEPHKFYVPFEVMERPVQQKRDLTVATAGAGGYLVATENMGFIEMLRNRSVAFRMGVRRLSGLNGSVTVPRQSAAATAYWLANEGTQITESQQTFVQMALTPKTVGAYTEVSRQLLLQSSPGAEGIVTDDLAQQVALAADLAVLNGSGASGQPLGIIGTAGIGSVSGTSLAAAGVLEFQTDVATSNVTPMRPGYVTTPVVAGLLMIRPELPTTGTTRLWAGNVWDGAMFGMPAMTSNQMPTANMLFGDWQEVVVGEWGVLEVEVNPYANFQAGIVGVRAIYSMDVGVRRPFAFSLATTIT
jgi:HK97 family phage major capsid protein